MLSDPDLPGEQEVLAAKGYACVDIRMRAWTPLRSDICSVCVCVYVCVYTRILVCGTGR